MDYSGDTYTGDGGGGGGGGGGSGGGPFGDGYIPPPNAASSTTFWDSVSNALETDYFNSSGSYLGSHWEDYGFQNEPTSDAGYFLNFNVGDGLIVGASLTYSPGNGFDLYLDGGYGDPGVTAGYTNSVSGFLSDWSATYNSDNTLWGSGQTFDPWAQDAGLQYGAMTLGTPGGSVTYGVEFDDFVLQVAGWVDYILVN